jgi:hypothetical protein
MARGPEVVPVRETSSRKIERPSRRHPTELVFAFCAVVLLFGILQFRTPDICCGDFDGYYHITWSRTLWEGLKAAHLPQFRSLPLTTLRPDNYADQHFLFHALLVPFTWFGSLPTGAKVGAVVFGSFAIISCFWLVWRYRIRYAPLWLLALLASSSLFLERMSMTRAQSLSLVFIVAGIALLWERKYRWLPLAGSLYIWTYNLFVVLGVMVVIWTAIEWTVERRLDWRPIGWTCVGFVAGFAVNPYFPRNLRLFWENATAKIAFRPGGGSEWSALPSSELLSSCFVAFTAMLIGYVAFGALLGRVDQSRRRRPLFLLILSTLLLIATAHSKRFTEYWPPMAVLFAAFTLQELWAAGERSGNEMRRSRGLLATVTLVLLAVLLYQVHMASLEMQSPIPPDQYRAGAEWIRAHAPAGEIVYNVNWDDFPKLFYYDPSRPYVSGLDPVYLSDANPELGHQYEQIAEGQVESPGTVIRSKFGARYVFASKPFARAFYLRAEFSGELEKVYEDQQCVIFQVK